MPRTRSYDVAVAGLGAVGSATAEALARRGLSVLGLDRHAPPHALGSTHGETRMIREAYFEAPFYVPLVQRALEAWRRLEERSGRSLLRQTAGIMIGPPECDLVAGSRESARRHDLPCEELSAGEIRRRFPALHPADGMVGILEPRAGYLHPEGCVKAFLDLAAAAGADLRFDEPLTEWRAADGGLALRTPGGEYSCDRLLVAAGSWIPALLPRLALPLTVERAVQFWFEPSAGAHRDLVPERCPVYAWEPRPGHIWYGFPAQPRGVKVGFHYGDRTVDPDAVGRTVRDVEVERMRAVLDLYLPAAAGPLREAEVCLYTNTPDHHFLIDAHPEHAGVFFVSACSGHGFKFASILGELLAETLATGSSAPELRRFRLDRLTDDPGTPVE
ncbi:MAG: N-methyl-L-tryptophan oxidase [Gemmatimonadota bacterium]